MPGQVEPKQGRRPQHALASAAMYLAIAAVYAPSLGYAPIALDDLSQRAHVAGKGLGALLWQGDAFGHFRPLKNLMFAFMAGEPARVSLVRALALAALLGTTFLLQRGVGALTRGPWIGLATAALWALHPSTATTVSWLSTTNLVVALLLILIYLACLARDALSGALVSLALALAAHELACVAPLLGWAYLHALGRPRPCLRDARVRRAAIGSLGLVAGYVIVQLLRAAPTSPYRSDAPAWLASLSAARYVVTHVALWLWPPGSFGVLLTDRPDAHVAGSVACWGLLLALAIGGWWLRGRDRVLDFALAWVLLTLLPVCNLAPFGNTPIALHYLYLPGLGLALALAQGVARARERAPSKRAVPPRASEESKRAVPPRASEDRLRRALVPIAAALAALLWLPETVRAVAAWEGEEPLYRATLRNHPGEVEVLSNLGSHYLGAQRPADARPLLLRARALAPTEQGVLVNLFALEMQSERPAEALALLDAQPALDAQPEFAIRRGEALEKLGRDAEAAAAFARGYESAAALRQPAQRYIGGYRLLVALVRLGREPEAEALLARMLAEFPGREELLIARRLLQEE